MVMSNDNCYDHKRFKVLQKFYLMKFNNEIARGHYRYRKVIRDSRTNLDMDYDDAMTQHYHDSIFILDLQTVLSRPISYLNFDYIQKFLPPNQRRLVTVTFFLTHVMSLYQATKKMIDIHFQQG